MDIGVTICASYADIGKLCTLMAGHTIGEFMCPQQPEAGFVVIKVHRLLYFLP